MTDYKNNPKIELGKKDLLGPEFDEFFILEEQNKILVEALERIARPCIDDHMYNASCDGCHRQEIALVALKKILK